MKRLSLGILLCLTSIFLFAYSRKDELKDNRDKYKKEQVVPKQKQLKPKLTLHNKFYFKTVVYPELRKSECGDCVNLCHVDPDDSGGLTCVGIAIKYNIKWFVHTLNLYHKSCTPHFTGKTLCNSDVIEIEAKNLLYKKYAKDFDKCGRKAYAVIVDSSVLEGQITAVRHIQIAHKLKVDGLLGENTLKACQDENFDAKAYTESRIKRFKTLKKCDIYCDGWIKRANKKLINIDK